MRRGGFVLLTACGRLSFDGIGATETTVDATGGDAAAETYSLVVMADAPAAYWTLDDASGSTFAADRSGNSRTGTINGMVELDVDGVLPGSRGMRFGGFGIQPGGYISVDGLFSFADRAPFTIECWHRPDVIDATWRIIAGVNYWTATRQGYTVEFIDDHISTDRRRDSNDESATFWSSVFTVGVWTHVASTYDGNEIRQYIDGAMVASAPSTLMILPGAVEPFSLSHPMYTVTGTLDECAVWERALPAERIAAHFNAR